MKKALWVIVAILVFSFVKGVSHKVGSDVGQAASGQEAQQKVEEAFKTAADQINAKGATLVDDYTRLDGAFAGPGTRLTYFYSLPKHTAKDLPPNFLQSTARPITIKDTCSKQSVALGYGATYVYVYRGKDNAEIGRFEINKGDCQY